MRACFGPKLRAEASVQTSERSTSVRTSVRGPKQVRRAPSRTSVRTEVRRQPGPKPNSVRRFRGRKLRSKNTAYQYFKPVDRSRKVPLRAHSARAAPSFSVARSRPSGAPAACWHGGGQGRPRCLLASHHEAAQGLECELGRYRPCCPCCSLPEALSGRLRRAVSTREGRPVQGR